MLLLQAVVETAKVSTRDIVTIVIFLVAWIGQLIWNIAKQGQINKHILETLDKDSKILAEHEKAMTEMKTWGEQTIKERIEYNERHYVARERFDDAMKNVNNSIIELKAVNIEGRLCRIEQAIIPFASLIDGIMTGKIVIQEIKHESK